MKVGLRGLSHAREIHTDLESTCQVHSKNREEPAKTTRSDGTSHEFGKVSWGKTVDLAKDMNAQGRKGKETLKAMLAEGK